MIGSPAIAGIFLLQGKRSISGENPGSGLVGEVNERKGDGEE